MKNLFTEGKYTARGVRNGATYSVEIIDDENNIVAYKWFRDADKVGGEFIPARFYDMIKRAIYRA